MDVTPNRRALVVERPSISIGTLEPLLVHSLKESSDLRERCLIDSNSYSKNTSTNLVPGKTNTLNQMGPPADHVKDVSQLPETLQGFQKN